MTSLEPCGDPALTSERHAVRNNVIGTVVGGLILGLLTWIFGFAPAVWAWVTRLGVRLWAVLSSSISVPVWLAIVIVVFGSIVLVRAVKRSLGQLASDMAPTAVPNPDPNLDELQKVIMARFAETDGAPLRLDDMTYRTQVSQLRIGEAFERLEAIGFLETEHNVLYGPRYLLTIRGRDYLMRHGLA